MKETIVVRLASRGQYKVGSHQADLLDELNDIDNQIVRLLSETEEKMRNLLVQMVERVIEQGEVIDDKLIDSDLILPPSDLNLAEAASLFRGEGIYPG
jgi:hypothetical protein